VRGFSFQVPSTEAPTFEERDRDREGGVGVSWTGSILVPKWACVIVVGVVLLFAPLLATLGMATIEKLVALDRAAEQRLLALQASQLSAQALAPGSSLACLDTFATQALQPSCEKALFGTAEATTAALTYVAAQLSLLEAAGHDTRSQPSGKALTNIRRALEADRFGLVAQVLAVSYGCTAEACERFAVLQDTRRVKANLAQGSFAVYVNKHTADLSGLAAAQEAVPPPAPVKPTTNLYIPSAASIPPVNIMTAEPVVRREPPQPTVSETAPPSRKPAAGKPETRAAAPVNNGGSRGAPLQISPGAQ
jgi:hypothetical protein